MPYEIVKKPSGKFQVVNKNTGEIHAKGTTLTKAKAQIRLLEMVDRKKRGGRSARPDEEYSSSESDSDDEMKGGKRENLVEHIQDLIDKIDLEGLPMSEGRAFYYNKKYRDIIRSIQSRIQNGENLPMNLIEPLLEEFAELIPHSELIIGEGRLTGGMNAPDPDLRIARQAVRRLYGEVVANMMAQNPQLIARHTHYYHLYEDRWRQIYNNDPNWYVIKDMMEQIREALGIPPIAEGGSLIQPINKKPDYNYCCGGDIIHPLNPKFLPFF
jgi:hypothetical protein